MVKKGSIPFRVFAPKNKKKEENKMEKQYFTKAEALQDIKDTLENGYTGYVCDLHSETFNADYYIIGTYQAKQALKQYDVFEAIEKVQNYEKDNFGEIYTDISNPEKLANMLYYIIGEETLQELSTIEENWNSEIDKEIAKQIIEEINDLLEFEE